MMYFYGSGSQPFLSKSKHSSPGKCDLWEPSAILKSCYRRATHSQGLVANDSYPP